MHSNIFISIPLLFCEHSCMILSVIYSDHGISNDINRIVMIGFLESITLEIFHLNICADINWNVDY